MKTAEASVPPSSEAAKNKEAGIIRNFLKKSVTLSMIKVWLMSEDERPQPGSWEGAVMGLEVGREVQWDQLPDDLKKLLEESENILNKTKEDGGREVPAKVVENGWKQMKLIESYGVDLKEFPKTFIPQMQSIVEKKIAENATPKTVEERKKLERKIYEECLKEAKLDSKIVKEEAKSN